MALYSYEEIDELGEGLIRQYLGAEADKFSCVDIEGFVTEFLGLPLFYRTFAEKDSDKIGFISDGITPLRIYKNGTIIPTVFNKGTIVIEKYLRRENESGRRRFTISHESAHFVMDRTVPQASFHREYDNERSYTPTDLKCLFSFKETQIDRMGAALLMPRFMVFNVAKAYGVQDGLPIYGDSILRAEDKLLIGDMANAMGVSFAAFLIRLREMGILRRHELSEYITGEMGLGNDDVNCSLTTEYGKESEPYTSSFRQMKKCEVCIWIKKSSIPALKPVYIRFIGYRRLDRSRKTISQCKSKAAMNSQSAKAGISSESSPKKASPASRYPRKTGMPFRKSMSLVN